MDIAIVGCGFVADYYMKTLQSYPDLRVVGVMDQNPERAEHFSSFHGTAIYPTLEALLADDRVTIVLNLTNPRSHYMVSKSCLDAGKHVYSEKPLAMDFDEAEALVKVAEAKGLQVVSAPCSLLSETAQTIWKALRESQIGTVRLVYAEMDDGLVHLMPYKKWLSEAGTPWPYKDEFEVGCTLEHAGYYVTWLAAFFGPVESVTAFSSCLIPDKQTDVALEPADTPDFSVACLKFANGVVARLTCGIVAPHDHELQIIGDRGVMSIEDCWFYEAPIQIRRMISIRRRTMMNPIAERVPLLKNPNKGSTKTRGSQKMDFARGVAELASSIRENRSCRLSSRFSLHVNEVVLAIQNALEDSCTHRVKTTFEPIEPMPWAQ